MRGGFPARQFVFTFCIIYLSLYKWIIKATKLDGDSQADQQQYHAKGQGDEITPGEGAANVPGALAALAKAAQLHRVRDDVDAVKAR